MLISFNWLKQFVNLSDSTTPQEVAERLNLSTVEVEKITDQGQDLSGVVVGKVLLAEKHPNADKLQVCQVDVGAEKLQIVCGGSNVRAGMLCAVAKLGAKVKWHAPSPIIKSENKNIIPPTNKLVGGHGEGDLVEMKEAAIRGVKSFGMISASTEIGLAGRFPLKETKEILDLSFLKKVKPGAPLAKVLELDDAVLEIDNKSLSHRPDLWGHYGLAREVAALWRKKLADYKTEKIKSGRNFKLKVEIKDPVACPRYLAVALGGVKVGPSPDWLTQKLQAAGLRSINNIVDITNYIMLELGQPMHAFDADKIGEPKQIIIRKAMLGEEFITLDNQKLKLSEADLVIANEEKPLALAGVMGGLNSGVTDTTQTIIFESANFEPTGIRRASLKHNLRTDSSMRFEKSLDPQQCLWALQKAVALTLELIPGAKVASEVVDKGNWSNRQIVLDIPVNFFEHKIGFNIPLKEIKEILINLGFELKDKKDILKVKVPSWRASKDVILAEDVVEEVLRIYGFNRVPGNLPSLPIMAPEVNKLRQLEHLFRACLVESLGYTEVNNYSFVSLAQVEKLGGEAKKYLQLDNPLSKEKPLLSRNLLANLLENVLMNIENYPELRLVEFGKTYLAEEKGLRAAKNSDELLPRQDLVLTAIFAAKKNNLPFIEARRVVEEIMAKAREDFKIEPIKKIKPWQHPERVGAVVVKGQEVGSVYELHPLVAGKVGLEVRLGVAEINLDKLSELILDHSAFYKSLPAYPEVERDLAVVVKKEVTHAQILSACQKIDPLLSRVELFDAYEGATIGEGYKSLAYRFTFINSERTLTTAEVDAVMAKIIKILSDKFSAQVRK